VVVSDRVLRAVDAKGLGECVAESLVVGVQLADAFPGEGQASEPHWRSGTGRPAAGRCRSGSRRVGYSLDLS